MLEIFYIGLDRWSAQTQDNHAVMLDKIQQRFGAVEVKKFLQPEFDRSDSPVGGSAGSSGGLQVWDFTKACQIMTAPVVMKWRTDNWFAESSHEHMLRAIDRVMSASVDVAYLGSNVKSGLNPPVDWHPTGHHKKVPDFVIVARRQALRDINEIRRTLEQADEVKNGNRVFKIIAKDLARCETIWCRIFLLRQDRDVNTDYSVATDFVNGYKANALAKNYLDHCDPGEPL